MTWNPLAPLAALAAQQPAAPSYSADEHAALIAALGHPAGRAWLAEMSRRLDGQASYRPGDSLDVCAWHESRRTLIHELRRALDAPAPAQE